MKPILIIKTGNTFPGIFSQYGDFEDWTISGMEAPPGAVTVVQPFSGHPLPDRNKISGVVITGSHAMVTDRKDWSETTAIWLAGAVENNIPVLGICFGHQLLAHAMGGRVDYHPEGREIGTVKIIKSSGSVMDPLFKDLPDEFLAHVSHSQSVLDLPPGATVLASNSHEPHHAFVLNNCAWGVQFHPEFSEDIVKSYIKKHTRKLKNEGIDPGEILLSIRHSSIGAKLLRNFYENIGIRSTLDSC